MEARGFVHVGANPVDKIEEAEWTSDGNKIVAWKGATLFYFDAATLDVVGDPQGQNTDKSIKKGLRFGTAFSRDYQYVCVTDSEGLVEVRELLSLKLISSFHHGSRP